MRKLTIGDNSHLSRSGDEFTARRASLADVQIGEVVLVRFKDECAATDYAEYTCTGRDWYDEWDKSRGIVLATFRRRQAEGGAE